MVPNKQSYQAHAQQENMDKNNAQHGDGETTNSNAARARTQRYVGMKCHMVARHERPARDTARNAYNTR